MLPGEGALAVQLKVSRKTVRGAYEILEREGLIKRRHGKGRFVVSKTPRGTNSGRFDVRADDPTEVNSVLMQFGLSGVLSPGEHIESATLELFSVREEAGLTWDLDMKAYPLLDLWVEGIGTTDGIGGSTDYPWGPASVGDAVYSYKQVSTVAPDPGFGNYDVATGGVAWTVGGGSDRAQRVGNRYAEQLGLQLIPPGRWRWLLGCRHEGVLEFQLPSQTDTDHRPGLAILAWGRSDMTSVCGARVLRWRNRLK